MIEESYVGRKVFWVDRRVSVKVLRLERNLVCWGSNRNII